MAIPRRLLALLAVLSPLSVAGTLLNHYGNSATPPAEPDFAAMLKDYKAWTRVNAKPYWMSPAALAACAAPGARQPSPHLEPDGYIDVYVNQVGRTAMLKHGSVAFPVGTIIVKEKRHAAAPADPELLTVMLKRPNGYNPEAGDWDFAVLDGRAATVQAQGKLENCMQCHKTTAGSDYVFRPYASN